MPANGSKQPGCLTLIFHRNNWAAMIQIDGLINKNSPGLFIMQFTASFTIPNCGDPDRHTSREIAGKTHTFWFDWGPAGERRRSGFGQAAPNSLTYIVNGMLRVFNFTCVKSILLEVHDFWLRRISFSFSSIFWKKKNKKNWNRGRVGTLNFFFAEFHVRDHPVSLQSNPRHSSNSTRQKVLEYRRRRQSI